MPRKYGKNMQPLPGFKANPVALKALQDHIEERRAHQKTKAFKRKFLAEPEELRILDTLKTMPEDVALDAAEGLLIARKFRQKRPG